MKPVKLPSNKNVLTIDPGLHGTGWAYWPEINANVPKIPSSWGVIKTSSPDWQDKSLVICSSLAEVIKTTETKQLVIEMPQVWTSGKSMAAATSGDLHKLMYLIGGFALLAELNENCQTRFKPIMISPQDWKGQMSKDAVINRIQKRFPFQFKTISNHEADAVGMGLALQGLI